MALQTLETIKSWFKTGLKPTQTQFWDTWDSFRHKSEKIPVAEIDGIDELLQNKTEKEVFENHLTDPNAHAESFDEKLDKGGFIGTAKNIDDRLSAIENTDRVLKFGTIALAGLDVTIAANAFAWVLNKISYLNPDTYSETIIAAATGMYRNDIVVGNENGTYEIIKGSEGATGAAAVEPSVPARTIKLGFISVFGASVIDSGSTPSIEKPTIVDNDRLIINDSDDSFSKKGIKFLNLKNALTLFFEALFLTQTTNQNISGIKTFLAGKFGLRNVANTFTSFFTNSNTASRTYTLQNRDGILLDNTDLSTINTALATKQSVFSGVSNYITKSINATTLGLSRLLDTGTYFGIGTINNPLKDITLGNQVAREIGIEDSDSLNAGRDLTLTAGRAINFLISFILQPLLQTPRNYTSMWTDSSNNVYAGSYNGSQVYKQTNSTGPFIQVPGTPAGAGVAGCIAPNGDFYLASYNGGIYKQTGGIGAWTLVDSTPRIYRSMCVTPNGDIFASIGNSNFYNGTAVGDIYKQTGGTGPFVAMGFPTQPYTLCSMPNGDVYVAVNGGSIYKILAGTTTLTDTLQTNRAWYGLATTPSGSDVYACVYNGDIYKQTGGTGNFVATGQSTRGYHSLAISSSLNIYACVISGDIYYVNINSLGTSNLNGGTLLNKAGTGKGTGQSRYQIWTGQKTVSGTDMQILTKRIEIDESGNYTRIGTPVYPDNTAALAGGLKVGMEYRTSTGVKMEVY
ncbi:hypothetical protein [uncultured Flavobacterium sp.]|uniref:hypothetical protein n=1 Tax=uncultured Flavobacterium sp. TaxID=165435 RepID=UPI00308205A0